MSGCFITFEGGEGAGKSTQIRLLGDFLKQNGYDVVITREPGGTPGGEAIRYVLLSGAAQEAGKLFETLLFTAARIDHVNEVIEPALKQEKIVLCDRFIDSTRVYQGTDDKTVSKYLEILEETAIIDLVPDITFILDMPAAIGMERADKRRGQLAKADRFEKDSIAVQESRRQAFLNIAKNEPKRCHVIDATQTIEGIFHQIKTLALLFLDMKINAST
ncbi:dTMP kinase [uncultured Bartonella sp.]|uniref:dTMP kinase n=1 Tax=uncultured Bartonella sp. TaxID=104108 RepID=UPI00260AEA8D|nr:dTMP kinase [uncultured Bartonella sp.]